MTGENRNGRTWMVLAILFAINMLNFFDRLIIAAVGEPIRKEFGLSDTALGALSTAFILLYAFVGIPFGRLADRAPRKLILSAGVFVWSLLTAGSGLVQSYWQLFAMRLGVGVGEATCAPAATSLIGDLFPSEKRARAMSIFMLGLPVGIALSFAISGSITKSYGWRAAFLVAGIPGILLAGLVLLIKEPGREDAEVADPTQIALFPALKKVLASPTMRWLIASGILHNFILYALSSFMTPYLMRYYGLDIQNASFVAMIINGIVTIPGLLLGGYIGDAANKIWINGGLHILRITSFLAVFFFYGSLLVDARNTLLFAVLMGGGFALMYFYYPIVYSAITNITRPDQRGTAMSIYFLAMYLFGGAVGPYVIGLLSDYFTIRAAFGAADLEPFRAAGLRSAMTVIPWLCVLLTFVMSMASRQKPVDMVKS